MSTSLISPSLNQGIFTPSGQRFEFVEQDIPPSIDPELMNYIANPNYATSRSKSSFNSTALNHTIGEAGLQGRISLHKNSTAKSGLNQTVHNVVNYEHDSNIRVTAN